MQAPRAALVDNERGRRLSPRGQISSSRGGAASVCAVARTGAATVAATHPARDAIGTVRRRAGVRQLASAPLRPETVGDGDAFIGGPLTGRALLASRLRCRRRWA